MKYDLTMSEARVMRSVCRHGPQVRELDVVRRMARLGAPDKIRRILAKLARRGYLEIERGRSLDASLNMEPKVITLTKAGEKAFKKELETGLYYERGQRLRA